MPCHYNKLQVRASPRYMFAHAQLLSLILHARFIQPRPRCCCNLGQQTHFFSHGANTSLSRTAFFARLFGLTPSRDERQPIVAKFVNFLEVVDFTPPRLAPRPLVQAATSRQGSSLQ